MVFTCLSCFYQKLWVAFVETKEQVRALCVHSIVNDTTSIHCHDEDSFFLNFFFSTWKTLICLNFRAIQYAFFCGHCIMLPYVTGFRNDCNMKHERSLFVSNWMKLFYRPAASSSPTLFNGHVWDFVIIYVSHVCLYYALASGETSECWWMVVFGNKRYVPIPVFNTTRILFRFFTNLSTYGHLHADARIMLGGVY